MDTYDAAKVSEFARDIFLPGSIVFAVFSAIFSRSAYLLGFLAEFLSRHFYYAGSDGSDQVSVKISSEISLIRIEV